MSPLEPLGFEGFSFGGKRTSDSMANLAEFIDPQYIDQGYSARQLGFLTPEPSPTDATPQHESFALTRSTYDSGSSAASSFMLHSGCETPSSSTSGSSASNSRRQSMMLPESQQHYLSAVSSSPSNRPQRPKRAAATDLCLLQDSSPGSYIASTDTLSLLIANNAAACTPGDDYNMVVHDYTRNSYGPQTDTSSQYGRAMQSTQIDVSPSWGRDVLAEINSSAAARDSHAFGFSRPRLGRTQPTIFGSPTPQPDTEVYDALGNSNPNPPSLAQAWEFPDTGVGLIDDSNSLTRQTLNDSPYHLEGSQNTLLESYNSSPPSNEDLECNHTASSTVKSRKRGWKQGRGVAFKIECGSPKAYPKPKKPYECLLPYPTGIGICDYACHRPEHLRRHKLSKQHMDENTVMLPCGFDGCINPKTGKHREIIARLDNLKAHYFRTHFRYGGSEKGGKNKRKSMKAAHEMDLSVYDARWTLLIGKKMDLNHEIKDYLHVWKMLGYSILETRDTKVKDVVPDWVKDKVKNYPVSEDVTLQEYDPRWRALWDGTLTFEKAMDRGEDMEESEAQGLLGVTMLETEAMGIRHLDPRWTEFLSSRMSVEQSEKLGVKQRNPVGKDLVDRRKAR